MGVIVFLAQDADCDDTRIRTQNEDAGVAFGIKHRPQSGQACRFLGGGCLRPSASEVPTPSPASAGRPPFVVPVLLTENEAVAALGVSLRSPKLVL